MTTLPAGNGPLAIFGGTFNPVHNGHLRSALELVERLQLDGLGLMPCGQPYHRADPGCDARHRAAMVEAAVASEPRLFCDRRELLRNGDSYTYDSLNEIREEVGAVRPLAMVMGCDALLGLDRWHRWESLLQLAHVVVITRPGWALPVSGPVAQWLHDHRSEDTVDLCANPAGAVLLCRLRPLPISSTDLREELAAGRSIRYLTPEPVLEYLHEHGLYGLDTENSTFNGT